MTTEHVSVPREELEELVSRFRKRAKQWADFGKYAGEAEATQCADDLQAILSRATPSDVRCTTCDGTGDVHRADGEWLGECTACDAKKTSAPRVVTDADVHIAVNACLKVVGDDFAVSFPGTRASLESFATSLPAARVPDRKTLRALVDAAWMEATETEQVPSTIWADRIIDSVLAAAPQAGEMG